MADDHREVYEALLEAHKSGQPAALVTVIEAKGSLPRHVGSKMLVYPDGRIVGTIGGGQLEARVIQEAVAALQDGKTRTPQYNLHDIHDGDPGICGGTMRLFIEPLSVTPTLLVIGGGHVGRALAELGKWAGFRVILSDDRPEFCNSSYIDGLDGYVVCPPAEVPQHVAITTETYVAAVTRGLPIDVNLIPALLRTDAPYIGLIGSRRRWAMTMNALKEQHQLDETQLQRVHAPIGLEIEAETPKEIAVSILAEIIMVRRGGTGQPMKWHGLATEKRE
ncbi:MAG: XdhC family protein [Chloroflexi bacterium]|nr:MAG: XdhC family protein [Chloroflexota bacterium]